MNILDIDIEKFKPYAIDAYIQVFGKEYEDIIRDKIKSLPWFYYDNIEGVKSYLEFLKRCKKKELVLKFLDKLSIDVGKQKEKGYAEEFDEDISNLVNKYLKEYIPDFLLSGQDGITEYFSKMESQNDKAKIIKFLNFVRGDKLPNITEENYLTFCKTKEYRQLIQMIRKLSGEIKKEYDKFLKTLDPYKDYCDIEESRKRIIEEQVKIQAYKKIQEILPSNLRKLLNEKTNLISGKYNWLLGDEIGIKSRLEYFSSEDEQKLNNPNTLSLERKNIIHNRIMFLMHNIGIDLSTYKGQFDTEEDLYWHLIEQPEIKELIPDREVVTKIGRIRQYAYSKAKSEYIEETLYLSLIHNSNLNLEYFITKRTLAVITNIDRITGKIFHKLVFTVRDIDQGYIDKTFLHEMCHTIENRDNQEQITFSTGFEENLDLRFLKKPEMNPYWTGYRKYERFNEYVTDIFANEATEYLHSKDIYFAEPKEVCYKREKNTNTYDYVRNLIKPFINKYRKAIIKARILGDYTELFNRVGQENFEELNDVISIIDYLWYDGVSVMMSNGQKEGKMLEDFNKQLERLQQVYRNMENYQAKSLEAHGEEDRG